VAGWAEVATLSTRRQESIHARSPCTSHAREAIMEDDAIQVAIDNLPYVGAEEAVLLRKDLIA